MGDSRSSHRREGRTAWRLLLTKKITKRGGGGGEVIRPPGDQGRRKGVKKKKRVTATVGAAGTVRRSTGIIATLGKG